MLHFNLVEKVLLLRVNPSRGGLELGQGKALRGVSGNPFGKVLGLVSVNGHILEHPENLFEDQLLLLLLLLNGLQERSQDPDVVISDVPHVDSLFSVHEPGGVEFVGLDAKEVILFNTELIFLDRIVVIKGLGLNCGKINESG